MIEPSINGNDLADTRLACVHSITYLRRYVEGEYPPHYPVPAIKYEYQWGWEGEEEGTIELGLFLVRLYDWPYPDPDNGFTIGELLGEWVFSDTPFLPAIFVLQSEN